MHRDPVKSEAEHRQDKCFHLLERLDPAKQDGFRWHCVKCGKYLKNKSGMEIPEPKKSLSQPDNL